jgi:hypothetical protein
MPHGPRHCAGPWWTHGSAEVRAHRRRGKNSSRPQRNGERAAAVLPDSFGGRGGDEGRSATLKHGGGACSSVSRCLRSGRVKLGCGVSVVRHGEGLGAFYRALDGVDRAEGRTTGCGSVELQWRSRFGWGRKWGGVMGSQGDERGSGADSFLPREGRGAVWGRRAGGGGAWQGGSGLAFGRKKEKGSWASAGPKGCAGL